MTTEFQKFFEDYAKTYDEFDVATMATYASCPLVTVSDGEPTCHDDCSKIESFFSKLLEWFREIEHGTASISNLEVQALGNKSAFAKVLWRSTKIDGSAFSEWPTAYQLVKLSGNWKILVIVLRYDSAKTISLS